MGTFTSLNSIGDTPACRLNFRGLLSSFRGLSQRRHRICAWRFTCTRPPKPPARTHHSRPRAPPGFTVLGKTALPSSTRCNELALPRRKKSLTCRGWRTLFDSSCSAWSCSAASIVEPLHRRPIAVGKSAVHLVCRPAALVACPCAPVQEIAKSQSAK